MDESALPSRFLDGAYLYGAGLFETMLLVDDKLPLLTYHAARLQDSLRAFDIPLQLTAETIQSGIELLIQEHGWNSGIVNLYISAGERHMEHSKLTFRNPYWIAVLREYSIPAPIETPISCCIARSMLSDCTLLHHKTMAYFHHILSLQQHVHHPVLVDSATMIMETPLYGLGFLRDNTVVFPEHGAILPSTSRAFIIDNAQRLKIHTDVRPIGLQDLAQFDGFFIHNAVKGIMPATLFTNVNNGNTEPPLLTSTNTILTLKDRVWEMLS